jgi:hypothetical protein
LAGAVVAVDVGGTGLGEDVAVSVEVACVGVVVAADVGVAVATVAAIVVAVAAAVAGANCVGVEVGSFVGKMAGVGVGLAGGGLGVFFGGFGVLVGAFGVREGTLCPLTDEFPVVAQAAKCVILARTITIKPIAMSVVIQRLDGIFFSSMCVRCRTLVVD